MIDREALAEKLRTASTYGYMPARMRDLIDETVAYLTHAGEGAVPVAWRSTMIGQPVEWSYTDDAEHVEWLRARSAGYILEPLYPNRRNEEVRPCTCHPDEAPVPCQRKYAYSDCVAAAAPHPPRQDGAREGETVFVHENALERLAQSASGHVLIDMARERRGDAGRRCTIPLYTTPPAPDEAVEAEREAVELLSELLTGAQVHNDRFPDRRIEGPLWNKAAALVSEYRARSRRDVGGGV